MASSSNPSQDSRSQFPSGKMSGESADSTIFKNEKQSGPSIPLSVSPQLRRSLSRLSPPSSRIFSLSPQTEASIANGSYHKVPSEWCPDDRVWSRDFYLSRNSLLKKMIHQSVLARINVPDTKVDSKAFNLYTSPEDCWVTFPIQPPIIEDPPVFGRFFVYEEESPSTSIGYVNLPVKSTRYSFKLFGDRPEPGYDGVPFPWVTNATGTKFLDSWSFNSPDREDMEIAGHSECPICGVIWRIEHIAPDRFGKFEISLGRAVEDFNKFGYDKVLKSSVCQCECGCDYLNPLRPIISDDLNKINWMFLFLGFAIGFCTIDQLKYYCIQRRLPISDDMNKIVFTVFDDLYQQVFLRRFQA